MLTKTLRRALARLCLALALLAMLLMSATPARAGWRSLSGPLPAYTDIRSVLISPDSHYVAFLADVESDEHYQLYSVPITGSIPVRLNPTLVAGGSVNSFLITPDSSRVVYSADQEVDERRELYSVPIGGGAPITLNGPLPTGGNVKAFQFDAESGRVVYIADQQSNDVFELYSVPLGGGGSVKLNGALASGGDVVEFKIDAKGGRVVYEADQDTNDRYELYSVPIGGGSTPIKLNPAVSQSVGVFAVTPGIAYVMFIAQASGASASELYGNDTTGGTPRKRNYNLAAGENVTSFRISPTAGQVVFTVGSSNKYGQGTLWRASPFGGASQMLSEAADATYGVPDFDMVFTPDGERVVYPFQKNATSPEKLQSVNVTGGIINRVDLAVADAGHGVGGARISPDGQWVVYLDYESATSTDALNAVPTPGGNRVFLGNGFDAVISPDSQRVVYEHLPPDRDHSDIMSTQIFGGAERNLSRVPSHEYAYYPQISPDGQWIVFQLLHSDGTGELVVSDGAQQPFRVFVPLARR